MSRKSTGTVDWRRNVASKEGQFCWHGRWTRADGTRANWVALDPSIPEHDEEGAKRFAATYAGHAKATTKDGKGETVEAYSKRWLDNREGKVASVGDDRARFTT